MSAVRRACHWGAAGVLAALLAACASVGTPAPGATREQVQHRWGEPRASYALPDGQRLFYRRKPGELQRLDFDANGRLIGTEQAFTAANFQALAHGHWDAAQVQRNFGPPARRVAAGEGEAESGSVWVYSWLDFGTWRLARVRMSGAGVVQGVDFSDDTLADERYR